MELVRVIENQANLFEYRATENEARAEQLTLLIESTKPKNSYMEQGWHPLIATPFRYSPPHPAARFRPPYGKNVFYGSSYEETALYEHAFHFMKQRKHLKIKSDEGIRTIFFVNAHAENAVRLRNEKDYLAIMDKNDYFASQQFIISNPHVTFIWYPSCRDPYQRDNAVVLDIKHLGKNIKWQSAIKFFYDNTKQKITWLDYRLSIQWEEVESINQRFR